jgi:hypothetical protein
MLGRNLLQTGNILGMFNQNKLVTQLNTELNKKKAPWTAVLDDSIADIEQISQKADAIICLPGLQKQFDSGNYPKERIFFYDSLAYHHLLTDSAIDFLDSIYS